MRERCEGFVWQLGKLGFAIHHNAVLWRFVYGPLQLGGLNSNGYYLGPVRGNDDRGTVHFLIVHTVGTPPRPMHYLYYALYDL